jgi:serine/threonine-protein kinase PpkA
MTETIAIPGYSIARKLGQGGMASVYLAVQHSFERDVALKVMSPLLNSDPSFAARFKREARIVAQLSHASIVPVFEVGEHQSCHYLSMEYLSGGDLKQRLLHGEHDLSLALNVCIALSAALDAAHRKGFVHRDIKPENVLFREDGTPVLTDFGIARALDSGRSMTLAGMLVGTPDYMSPEQVKGLELDGRSDLYSLGIVFFEIVTGAVPFKADSNLSVALKQLGEPLPALPSEYAAYQEFLDCLTAKDREQRFASGAEIIRALRVIGTERTVRNRALARSATMPGVTQTGPAMLQAEAPVVPTPSPASDGYASRPTLAWPRASATPVPVAPAPSEQVETSQRSAETPQRPADPPLGAGAPSAGARGNAPHWIKALARRSQPVWMGAAALAAFLVGVTLIVGSFRKGAHPPSTPMPVQTAPVRAAPVAATTAAPPTDSAVATQPQQAAQIAPAPVSAVPAPATPTAGQDVVQTADSAALAKPAADTDTRPAQADTAARRKRLLEERRQRKADEANRLAQQAADVRATQLKEQEMRIQEMLVEAKNEYAAGALWQPAGANAADHYRDILKMQPERAEALAGARRVAEILTAEAAQTESIGDVYNSGLLIAQVQSLQPDHPKLAGLQAKLQQLESTPTSPDTAARSRLDRAAKLIARAEEDLGHSPLDYHAVDDATDQYDRAVSIAPMAPGLPSLRERLTSAYPAAVQTEINNHDLKHAHKLINTARKRKWTSDELDQLEASLQAAGAPPAAVIKEAGASDGSTH